MIFTHHLRPHEPKGTIFLKNKKKKKKKKSRENKGGKKERKKERKKKKKTGWQWRKERTAGKVHGSSPLSLSLCVSLPSAIDMLVVVVEGGGGGALLFLIYAWNIYN